MPHAPPDSYAGALLQLLEAGPLVPTAEQLADTAIEVLAHVSTDRPMASWATDVLAVLMAVPLRHRSALFWLLDGGTGQCGPGWYGYTREVRGKEVEWHWKLRRLRNDPAWGPRLFKLLDADLSPRPWAVRARVFMVEPQVAPAAAVAHKHRTVPLMAQERPGDDCGRCNGTGIGPGQAGPVDGWCTSCRGTGVVGGSRR